MQRASGRHVSVQQRRATLLNDVRMAFFRGERSHGKVGVEGSFYRPSGGNCLYAGLANWIFWGQK